MEEEKSHALTVISQVVGIIYTVAWSASFYGQLWENFKHKSVHGISFDFVVYNFTGFLGYTVYTIWGSIDDKLGTGPVSVSDIIFASHALGITIITMIQIRESLVFV
jgi:cystinosin